MVSTRSGRQVVSGAETAGRVTRARTKKEEAMDAIEEVGQPEVSSPAPSLLFTGGAKSSKNTPGAFGSPAAFGLAQTPGDSIAGTPLQERVVKTVGRTPIAQTPGAAAPTPVAATPGPAPTPSAKAVKQIASVPLPDDADSGETEPYVSSDDEPPMSPGASQPPAKPASARIEARATTGKSWFFFPVFAAASIFVTVLIALLLTPCTSPDLYALMSPATYHPICKGVANIYSQAAEVAWRIRAEAVDQSVLLHSKLPPAVQSLLAQAWEPVQQAHAAALPVLNNAAAQLEEHAAPLRARATQHWKRVSHAVYVCLAPVLDASLARLSQSSSIPAAAEAVTPPVADPTPSSAALASFPIPQAIFISMVDIQQQHYARELWDNARRQVAAKRKAVAWVLTCSSPAECGDASDTLFAASTSLIHIDGVAYAEPDSAGALQLDLVTFLREAPTGLVMITNPARLHINCIAVLNAALSESGHLQMNGVPVPTERALYIIILELERAGEGFEADDEQAVKDWLTAALVDKDVDGSVAIARSFRRRLDAILPVRSASTNSVSWDTVTFPE